MVILMFLARHIQKSLELLKNHAKVVMILGARQVGKSPSLKQDSPKLPHFIFDPCCPFKVLEGTCAS